MRELLQSKRFWATTAIIAVLALALAAGASGTVAWLAALPDDAELMDLSGAVADADAGSAAPTRQVQKPGSLVSFKDPIVDRSIFDSSKVGVKDEGGDPETEYGDLSDACGGGEARKSDLGVKLLATLVARNPDFSSALITEDGKGDKAYGYAMGAQLIDATVVGIYHRCVVIERNKELEYIHMDGTAPALASSGAKRSSSDGDEEAGITKEGDKIIVERAVVDEALNNVEALASKLRVVPHKGSDGQIDGYRLSAIRRGSLFDKLGIKNGDVIHGVNGMPLTSMEGAMQAFQALQSESAFSFDLTRRNQKQTFDYEIR